ncbi:MAG: hypothetical protein JHC93_08600 [Parachlamydiales bacterium]|nr:hypothetical protein [Parachlamydiales bacterium]
MNITPNPYKQLTLDQITGTFKLIEMGMGYDANLKPLGLIKDRDPKDFAEPHTIVDSVYQQVHGIVSANGGIVIPENKWNELYNKVSSYVQSANYSNPVNKEFCFKTLNNIRSCIDDEVSTSKFVDVFTDLKNVYLELDELFCYMTVVYSRYQIKESAVKLKNEGVIISHFNRQCKKAAELPNVSFDEFKFHYQQKNIKLKSNELKKLNHVLDNIKKITENNDRVDINLVEDIVKDILELKIDVKILNRSCDQFISALKYVLNYNEQRRIYEQKSTPKVDYSNFPKDFVRAKDFLTAKELDFFNSKKNSSSYEYECSNYIHQNHATMKKMADELYKKIGTEKQIENLHYKFFGKFQDLNFIQPKDGPEVFELNLPKLGEGIFIQYITDQLIDSLTDEIKAERAPSKFDKERNNEAKVDTHVKHAPAIKMFPSIEMEAAIENISTPSQPEVKNQVEEPLDLVQETIRLNTLAQQVNKDHLIKPVKSSKKEIKSVKTNAVEKTVVVPSRCQIKLYCNKENGKPPFTKWLKSLTFEKKSIVDAHLENFKDRQKNAKPLNDGLHEIRVLQYGLRVYFKYTGIGKEEITIISGGDKASQKADIIAAKAVAKTLSGL